MAGPVAPGAAGVARGRPCCGSGPGMRGLDRTAAHRRCGLPPSAAWRPRLVIVPARPVVVRRAVGCPGAAGRCTPDRSRSAGRCRRTSLSRRGRSLYAGRSASRRGRSLYAGRSVSRRGRSLYAGRSASRRGRSLYAGRSAVPARPVVVRRTLSFPARPVVVRRTLSPPGAAGRCTPDARFPTRPVVVRRTLSIPARPVVVRRTVPVGRRRPSRRGRSLYAGRVAVAGRTSVRRGRSSAPRSPRGLEPCG